MYFFDYMTGYLSKTIIKIKINGVPINALIDTGGSENFIDTSVVKTNRAELLLAPTMVNVALSSYINIYTKELSP